MIDRYRNYRPVPPTRKQVKKPKVGRYFVLLIFFVILIGFLVKSRGSDKPKTEVKSSEVKKVKPKVTAEPISSDTWGLLASKMNTLITENNELDISVAVIDVDTGTKANYGIQNNFAGASTTKILTAVAYLHDIENGKYKLNNDGKNQLRLMINQSDNTAWTALNKKVGYENLNKYAQSINLSSYDYKENIITAGDEALLLQRLYKRELLNEDHTSLILSYMQNTNNEAMLPKITPEDATVWHKYGQLEDRLHDAGIINFRDRTIVIVVYTKGGVSDGSNYRTRADLVGQFGKTILDTIYTL